MERIHGVEPTVRDLHTKVISTAMHIYTCPPSETTTKPPGFKRTQMQPSRKKS